jgi:5-bromo-4-chloroindolyl phosphate hydrolysis protein
MIYKKMFFKILSIIVIFIFKSIVSTINLNNYFMIKMIRPQPKQAINYNNLYITNGNKIFNYTKISLTFDKTTKQQNKK